MITSIRPFRDVLREGKKILFDGSTSSALFEKGLGTNRNFDEASLKHPDWVRSIHLEFLKAGSQVLTTNTWGANRFRLASYGLEHQVEAINLASVKLAQSARSENDSSAWIGGCLGPLGLRIEPWGPTSFDEAKACFREQALVLQKAGIDCFVLESFEDIQEIHQAILAIQEIGSTPIVAMMNTNDEGSALFGCSAEQIGQSLTEWGVDVLGVNGGNGPAVHLRILERLRKVTSLPLISQPSPGLPNVVDGRVFFMASPQYLGEFANKALALGAQCLGGCSGTSPDHIRAMGGSFRQARAFHHSVSPVVEIKRTESIKEAMPQAKRSLWAKKVVNGDFVTSVELVPPNGMELEKMIEKARHCQSLGVDAINIPDGPRAMARISALATAVIVEREVGIETVLHYACRDRNLLGMQSDLLGAAALKLKNILAVTGDPPKLGPYPNATGVFDVDAIGLVHILRNLNIGIDIGGGGIGNPTAFSIGVGANPVAPDTHKEESRFKWKVEAGAEWAITQPIFDATALFKFLDFAQPLGIPIVAGIWPFKHLKNAEFMANEVPGVFVPPSLLERMGRFSSQGDQLKEGQSIARELMEKVASRVVGFQISAPFGQVENIAPLLEGLKSGRI